MTDLAHEAELAEALSDLHLDDAQWLQAYAHFSASALTPTAYAKIFRAGWNMHEVDHMHRPHAASGTWDEAEKCWSNVLMSDGTVLLK